LIDHDDRMDITYRPIDPDRLSRMRAAGEDEFGNPWRARTAKGWDPLRCCLRRAEKGADIALISYSPWPLPSPEEDPEAAVRDVLAEPDVAHLHVRSAIAQCFTFEARPA
jgi:Protein of unknown function (DUF1203)